MLITGSVLSTDWTLDPLLAIKVLSGACIDLSGLHFQIHDPLNCIDVCLIRHPWQLDRVQGED